jgi:thioredoxin-like negative regulator of GroEL
MHEWIVACLCAEWCGSCREYRDTFEAVARALGGQARFAWIDIEEQPDVMGDLEVESFPSLLVMRGDEIAFYGAVTPHASTLEALVRRAIAGDMRRADDPALAGLPARVREAVA